MLFEWYNWLDTNLGIPLDLIVYLRTSPQVPANPPTGRDVSELASLTRVTIPLGWSETLEIFEKFQNFKFSNNFETA